MHERGASNGETMLPFSELFELALQKLGPAARSQLHRDQLTDLSQRESHLAEERNDPDDAYG